MAYPDHCLRTWCGLPRRARVQVLDKDGRVVMQQEVSVEPFQSYTVNITLLDARPAPSGDVG
jgi:hypothetical protein